MCRSDANKIHLDSPSDPRQRRPPTRCDQGAPPAKLDVRDNFKMLFYQLLDTAIGTLCRRMEQPALKLYTTAAETILSAANSQLSPEVTDRRAAMLCEHFWDDLEARENCD